MKKLLAIVLAAVILFITPPVWIDKQLAPWLPGSIAWGNFAGSALTKAEVKDLAYHFVPALRDIDFEVIITTDAPGPNAWFAADAGWLFDKPSVAIGLVGISDLPRQAQLLILLHEIAHARQWFDGMTGGDRIMIEYEADRQGTLWACELGIESGWAAFFWVWLYQAFGYNGDPNHPSPVERIGFQTTCPTISSP